MTDEHLTTHAERQTLALESIRLHLAVLTWLIGTSAFLALVVWFVAYVA